MSNEEVLRIRLVVRKDRELMWVWANDPTVCRASFSETWWIPSDTHKKWFAKMLADPNAWLYIVEDVEFGRAVGQVRFERVDNSNTATVSISISAPHRGKGYGSMALRLALKKLRRESDIMVVQALVKANNMASFRAFFATGFVTSSVEPRGGDTAWRMVKDVYYDYANNGG